jgi:hypothetical protein
MPAILLFHGRQIDNTAQTIVESLKKGPMSGNQLHALFNNHLNKDRLETLLSFQQTSTMDNTVGFCSSFRCLWVDPQFFAKGDPKKARDARCRALAQLAEQFAIIKKKSLVSIQRTNRRARPLF